MKQGATWPWNIFSESQCLLPIVWQPHRYEEHTVLYECIIVAFSACRILDAIGDGYFPNSVSSRHVLLEIQIRADSFWPTCLRLSSTTHPVSSLELNLQILVSLIWSYFSSCRNAATAFLGNSTNDPSQSYSLDITKMINRNPFLKNVTTTVKVRTSRIIQVKFELQTIAR